MFLSPVIHSDLEKLIGIAIIDNYWIAIIDWNDTNNCPIIKEKIDLKECPSPYRVARRLAGGRSTPIYIYKF